MESVELTACPHPAPMNGHPQGGVPLRDPKGQDAPARILSTTVAHQSSSTHPSEAGPFK